MARTMLPLILTTTNSILPNISCEMEAPRVISGFKRVAWPELRRLPLKTLMLRLPADIEQVRRDIESEAFSIMKKHGLQFKDEEDDYRPEMEIRGVPEKSSTGVPTILILAPWSTEKQRDWETAAREMASFLADLSKVCSFGETDIHVEITAPELVHRTYYTNIDDPVFQSAWECLSTTIFNRLQSLRAIQGHTTCLSLQKYGTNDVLDNNPPTVYISVGYDSDETQWLKKRTEDGYYSTVHIGDDFGAARDIKRTDGERLSPTNGTIGCFVQLKTSDPEPTWRTFILTSYQAVQPAFDGFTVTPNGTDSSVAPPTRNSDLWTVDSVGYTPSSSVKPTAFESPSRSKHHFNIRVIDEDVAYLTNRIQRWEEKDQPTKERQLQTIIAFRERIAALRDERKQKTEFLEANKQALGRLHAFYDLWDAT
ncbi:hypothetical protein FANTH_13341 [Fusarium anthophilum]|uniref:Uncharacterized protein n=1 Tax=Fusarium anthophilum TaxID=48485 RepID=A0A8H4YNX9_9HYPO|nr:hypothetical protein FANTH_13341 [Fusarium anthophilum]